MVSLLLEKDGSSLSNPQHAIVKHLDWNVQVDFDRGVVFGTATYDVEYSNDDSNINKNVLSLDTAHLDIVSVSNAETSEALTFQLHSWIPDKLHLGQKLEITLPTTASSSTNPLSEANTTRTTATATAKVAIQYSTTTQSSALQWLPPAQTAGKKYPYLFTQCQAIHARTLIPCQDTPGVKFTYSAHVTVPSWATAVLSAVLEEVPDGEDKKATPDDAAAAAAAASSTTRTFVFHQKVPIPSYLLAMAVGELTRYDLSPRCAIWTEPSLVDAAAYEFAQTEDFLQIAEDIAGLPYVWGRYDLLLLPPSFPYGGMENPCLTFVTPTLLAGDRSLADVVAHEISHSWTGNLVTNVTWDHFWLNEGWTTWFQRAIMIRIHNNEKFRDMDAIGGYKDLEDAVKVMPLEGTRLVLDIGDNDPDEFYSIVAYEKGFNLLYALEQRVGSPAFYQFFKAYVKEFAYKTLSSQDFQAFFQQQFPNKEELKDFDWETWYHKPGMPPDVPQFDRTLTQEAEDLAQRWITLDRQQGGERPSASDLSSLKPQQPWSSDQTTCFLDTIEKLANGKPLQVSTLSLLNQQFGFLETKNSEILFRYCKLAVAAEDDTVLPVVVAFITSQGRMKYVRPLYRALAQSKMGHDAAITAFLEHRDNYHPICAKMIALDLKVEEDSKPPQLSSTTSTTTTTMTTTTSTTPETADAPPPSAGAKRSGVERNYWIWAVGAAFVAVGVVVLRRSRR